MKFEGTLTQEEFDFVLEIGLNYLVKNGALPMIIDDGQANLVAPSDELQ